MSEESWTRARGARDELVARLLSHPDVSMVDIGLDEGAEGLVVQVHVRRDPAALPEIPAEVDGIPVRVVRGDYRPEDARP